MLAAEAASNSLSNWLFHLQLLNYVSGYSSSSSPSLSLFSSSVSSSAACLLCVGSVGLLAAGFTHIAVSEEKAELERLVVLSHPYTTIGKTLSAEATIKGLRKGTGLKLEFWVETPSGKSEEQAKINIKELSAGEEARYTAEFTPKETGHYTIHAYLCDDWKRIGHKTDSIYALASP
jgi:uncharacterized protein (DUF58 family)